jgi:prepilin-type N-terminal cleavage/methylation domain-containing protein/prepilin-type processing-associated H-X9-DG protein
MSSRRKAFTLIELLVVVAIIALLISILLPSLSRAKEQAKAVVCASNLRQMGIALTRYLDENEAYYPGEHSAKDGRAYNVFAPRIRKYAAMEHKLFWCPTADPKTWWMPKMDLPRPQPYLRGYGYQWGEWPLNAEWELFCYGYNSWGVAETFSTPGLRFGLGAHVDDYNVPWVWNVRTADVKMPADMICIADSKADGNWDTAIDPESWQDHEWPSSRHFGGAEVLFCDGHALWEKQETLVEPTEWSRQRWNNDHKPHVDYWQ